MLDPPGEGFDLPHLFWVSAGSRVCHIARLHRSYGARHDNTTLPYRQMSAITDLIAGVPVSDLDASIDWYTRFFGRAPDMRAGDEVLWDVAEHATLFIEPNAARAGAGRITFAVAGLDALLARLAAQRIEHEPIETYSNGVRHVTIPDPDGNAIAFAEPPDAAGNAVAH